MNKKNPKKWAEYILENIADINYGTRIVKDTAIGNEYYVYGGGDKTFLTSDYNRENTLVIARFGMSPKCTRFIKGKFFLNDSGLTVETKDKKILNQEFLNWQLYFLNDYIYLLGKGVAQKNLNVPLFKKIKIAVPKSINEQQEIAQVLDTMSDIIRLREECISHTQDLIPALFQEIFKPYVNYTKKTLNNLFEFKSGGTPSRLVKKYFQGDIPWITTVALNKLYINKDDANELITEEAIQNSSTKLIPANSLLFGTRVGIGKLAINTVPMCTNQDIVAMIPLKNNNLNLIYVYWYLKQINNFFVANGRGATIQGITTHLVRSTEIILPPLKIQEQFAQKVIEIESYIKEQQEELENAKQMFQALLHHAFTGELTNNKSQGDTLEK